MTFLIDRCGFLGRGLALLALTALLGACTGLAGDARRLVYEDAVAYVEENHAARRQLRAKARELDLAMIEGYQRCILLAQEDGAEAKAQACYAAAQSIIAAAGRELASVEALRAAVRDIAALRRTLEGRGTE